MKLAAPLAATLTFTLALALASVALPAAPRPRARQGNKSQGAARPAFAPDKGRFRILLDGADAGNESFEFSASNGGWIARGESTVKVPNGGEMRSSGQLRLGPDGAPIRYDWSAQSPQKAAGFVDFMGSTAKASMSVGGKDAKQDFTFPSPRIVVLDNNLYDQYAVIGRLYDWNAKGTQIFPVLIPQDVTPGSISVEPIGAANGAASALRVKTSDVAIELYFDANRRLIRLEVPAAKVVVLRQ